MAIIITDETTCSICNEVLADGQELYATTAFLSPEHSLWRFSDSGMHWDCFESWEHREEFVSALVEAVTAPNREWGYDVAFAGECCSIVVNVVLPEDIGGETIPFEHRRATPRENPSVTVWLHRVGLSFSMKLNEWDEWLEEEHSFNRDLCTEAWKVAKEEIRCISSQDLISKVETDAVYEAWNLRAKQQLELDTKNDAEKKAMLSKHNEKFHAILKSEPDCPHCGESFPSLKYYDNRGNERKSCVICQECARSSRLEEFQEHGNSQLK